MTEKFYSEEELYKPNRERRAGVVVQLVERLLPTQEVCSSNPVISKILKHIFLTVNCLEKMNVKKEAGSGTFNKTERHSNPQLKISIDSDFNPTLGR